MGRRPGGFPRAELAQHRAGGVIYHVHETAVGGAIFQPGMKAGIQLHQFAEMRLAHPALAIPLSRSLAARLCPPHVLVATQLFAAQSISPQSECLLSKAL